MTHYRDDLEAARARIETLEAKIREREAALDARDAELAELRGELERARRGQAEVLSTEPHELAQGGHRALLVALAACTFLTAAAYAMVRPARCSSARWRPAAPAQVQVPRVPAIDVDLQGGRLGALPGREERAATGEEFDRPAAGRALADAARAAKACRMDRGPMGVGRVRVTFAPTGRVSSARVDGAPFEGTPTAACVAGVFRAARVPSFEGAPVSVTKSFSLE